MHGDGDNVWEHYPSCLVYRIKENKIAWSTGIYNSTNRLVEEHSVTINQQWNNLCFSADGENPLEKPGEQSATLDLDKNGHVGLFSCRKSGKWACHMCKQYGYFTIPK